MSWTSKPAEAENAGKKFEIPPAGSHAANLVAIIDLGTHDRENDKKKIVPHREIFLVWELCHEIEAGTTNRHLIGERYNLSTNPKAKLRIMLETWRGKQYAVNEEVDVARSLGKPCLVSITHKDGKEGKTYANLKGVSNLPAGMTAKPPVRPLVIRECTSLDPLPEWLPRCYGEEVREIIYRCHECRPSKDSDPAPDRRDAPPAPQQGTIGNTHESVIPF